MRLQTTDLCVSKHLRGILGLKTHPSAPASLSPAHRLSGTILRAREASISRSPLLSAGTRVAVEA